jgi:hypothetical protein
LDGLSRARLATAALDEQAWQTPVHVVIDLSKRYGGMTYANVRAPTPEHWVERRDDVTQSLNTQLFDDGKRHGIDIRRAPILFDASPRFPQDVTPVDAVHQRVDTPARLPFGRTPESTSQLAHSIDGRESVGEVGTGPAGHALHACLLRRLYPRRDPSLLPRYAAPVSSLLRPLGVPLRRARFRRLA